MSAMRLFLARHGETTWNVEHRLQGQSDIGLTARGEAHARALAALLHAEPLDAVFTSPLRRSIDTARPLVEARHLPAQIRPELIEMNYGRLEGHTPTDPDPEIRRLWEARKADPIAFRAPGGETYAEVRERVAPFAAELREQFAGRSVLVVGHRGTNRVLLAILLGWPLRSSLEFRQKHDRVLEIRPGEVPDRVEHRYAPAAAPAKE
jgi:broad specificity phosphatase PhoE